MVELVIVVIIIGILGAVAVPRYLDTLANYRANATARRIVADLKMAIRRAQQTSTSQTVVFDVVDSSYEVTGMNDLDRSSEVYEHRLPEIVDQAKLVSADFGGSSTLAFDIYGRPSSAGTIVFNVGRSDQTIEIEQSGNIIAPTQAEIAALEAGP